MQQSELIWHGQRKGLGCDFVLHSGHHHHHQLNFITGYLLFTITQDYGDGRSNSNDMSYVLRAWDHDGRVWERRFSLAGVYPEYYQEVLDQLIRVIDSLKGELSMNMLKNAKMHLLGR